MGSNTIGLLTLPAELRLRSYDYLPDLSSDNMLYIAAGNTLTPHICRTNKLIRQETLPLFAQNRAFWINLAAKRNCTSWFDNATTVWTNGLGDLGLAKLSKLTLSRHWELSKPTRNQAHVGFYLKLERQGVCNANEKQPMPKWQTTVGTYPVANDMRGMRRESAELLKKIVVDRLGCGRRDGEDATNSPETLHGPRGFTRSDLEFLLRAIDIIARHPFSTQDLDQDDQSKQRRRSVFQQMEEELMLLVRGRETSGQGKILYPLDGEDVKLYSRQ